MGQKSQKREAFLRLHPNCCFCGGRTPAEEVDHVPSRATFRSRHWPEGYEFPACVSCNRNTRYDELVVAMLARIYPDARTDAERAEVHELMRSIAHNLPGVLQEMQPTARQLRNASARYGLERPEGGTYADIPALSVSGPLINNAVINVGRKLFCALFYKHTGTTLSAQGGIGIRWYTNLQIEDGQIPEELAQILPLFPRIERSRQDLQDQFFYGCGTTPNLDQAAFLAFFRQSFGIVGYVHQSKSEIPTSDHVTVVSPFCT